MHGKWLLAACLAVPLGATFAQEPPAGLVTAPQSQQTDAVHAATDQAVCDLYAQVARMPLASRITVADFLRDIDGRRQFLQSLSRADQIGAPRWIDDQTVQVQLQVSTEQIRLALRDLAEADARLSPLTPDEIDDAVKNWPRRAFTGTGASAGSADFRPPAGTRWQEVDPATRQKALAAARADAADRALAGIAGIRIDDRTTLAQALADREVAAAVRQWLDSRPITRVDFRDSLEVEVEVSVDSREFLTVVKSTLSRHANAPAEDQWKRIEREFTQEFQSPVGRSEVRIELPRVRPSPLLPADPPRWVMDRLVVEGASTGGGDKLKTRLQADAAARKALHAKLESLPLERGRNVADAATTEPRLNESVRRAVRDARIYKTQYNTDGSATVYLMSDLTAFWDDLRRTAGQ